MPLHYRIGLFICFVLAVAGFRFAPELFSFDESGTMTLAIAAQIGGPAIAAIACFIAAWRSAGSDRTAWFNFGAASLLYFAGNLGYLYFTLTDSLPQFPSAPEAAFFVMALFFASGTFQYAKVRDRLNRVQLYNFILIYCAVTLGSLFTLGPSLATSILSPFGTMVAFLYPALWFSVAATGLVSMLIYDHGSKAFPMALMLLAVLAESIADYSYVLRLMDGTYQVGGLSQLLWVASGGLITWAAIEQMAIARRPSKPVEVRRAGDRRFAQASVPAAAVATILLSGSFTGALGLGTFVWLSAALGTIFAVVVARREYWIIETQRRLREGLEDSRTDLMRSQQRMRAVLESTSDSVLVLDREWRLVYHNQQAAEIIDPEQLRLGETIWELFPETGGWIGHDLLVKAVETRQPTELEVHIPGTDRWLGVNAYPTAEGLSIFFRDISERRRAREEITYLAHHDALTGLANRTLFQRALEDAIVSGKEVAVLVVDLDHFKEVNDSLGHPIGDAVLTGTARRLEACAPEGATVSRLGGDEFAIILTAGATRRKVLRLAGKVLKAMTPPHEVDGLTVRASASIGIALGEPTEDADRLFKKADIALYAAKAEARGSYRVFEAAMEAELQERQALRADLAVALERKEFELVYQPLVDLKSNRVSGFETLLRWRHPVHGMISPARFIPIAEDSGMMVAIGDWVLRTACEAAAHWPTRVSLAVNLSTRQFADTGLVDKIALTLEATGLPHQRLELEITESVLLKDDRANLKALRRLRELGIRIALDDFGTGYSSLGYLQQFPFSKIKIDRSFIDGLPDNEESQAIVRAVTGLGRSLGMRVTAEGVETEAQLDWIRSGCDEVQGYLISKPVPASGVPGLMAAIDGRARRLAS